MADLFKKIVESPAVALEKTAEVSKEAMEAVQKPVEQASQYWRRLGPGLTTGAADDDPSGITTYSQAGAAYGPQLLWLASFTFPLMAIVQEMCARIGLVTGQGLAANIRIHYPRWVLYFCTILLFGANTFNIGANLGAMAKTTQLLSPQTSSITLVIIFALFSLLLQVFTTYERYAKYLKYLTLILFSYILTAFLIENFDWGGMLKAAISPSITFSRDQIFLICGILGTTISPYLFFWQTSQEVEEQILEGKTTIKLRQNETTDREINRMRIDVWTGMFFSNLVMFFIIAVTATVLWSNGITNITSAADAAEALRPLAGGQAYLLFTLGIIGTGFLAIPILAASASYALSESLGWKYGLYRKLKEAYAFYGVIILSMFLGIAINFIGLDPIKTLIYAAVANGLVAPVVLILILGISSNQKVMGGRVNGPITKLLGWIITLAMIVAGAATLYSFF